MSVKPHSPAWYDRLATMQRGYWYPWAEKLGKWNGEDEYLPLVEEHLGPAVDLLDVGCAHGAVALDLAPRCRSILAYDRVASWIDQAKLAAQAAGVTNVTYLCHDSSMAANGGAPRIPAADNSFDLLISRRGPFHWIEDASRVARPGATLIMLVPDARPLPPWNDRVPEPLRWQWVPDDPNWARKAIEARLAVARVPLHSWWSFDVSASIGTPEQFYTLLAWGYAPDEVPAYGEVAPVLAQIFTDFAGSDGLEIRHLRHLWKAVVPASGQ